MTVEPSETAEIPDAAGIFETAGTETETEITPRGILVVTGTGTGIGKTVVTAAIAALARAGGATVAVVKPAQTGVHPGPGSDVPDAETIERLSGVADLHELSRFPDPLSPEAAARVSGLPPLDIGYAAEYIAKLADSRDLVLVEGAGGLLVRYNAAGATIADLAARLGAPVLVVAAAGLGTLNHTALTLEAIAARKLRLAGVVIGCWPREPDLAARENLADLETVAGGPLAGLLAEGSGSLPREAFRAAALHGLGRSLGGSRGAQVR